MDFARLKETMLRRVQELSGTLWTDYNEHDPGVTIAEQLCFALTELSYRAELPIADLLTSAEGDLEPERHGLYAPREIFPCAPVSANDYRRLLVDRLPPLANAWLYPHLPAESDRGAAATRGLYDLYLYAPGPDPCSCEPGDPQRALIDAVRRLWSQHRSLCEDLRSVQLLQPRPVRIAGQILLTEGDEHKERIVAELLFALARALAPELQREPLHVLHRAGLPLDEIFTGPLLRSGCIPEDQLTDKPSALGVADVVRVISACRGVRSVQAVALRWAGERGDLGPGETLQVARGEILMLDIDAVLQQPGLFCVLRRGQPIPCVLDVARVRGELGKLFAAARRPHPLSAQDLDVLPQPSGRSRELASYHSIQNHFPLVYGIGAAGLPLHVSAQRRAQARQLKGYLMVFEQSLADYCTRLSGLREQFSLQALPTLGTPSTAGGTDTPRSLLESVPDAGEIVCDDYLGELARHRLRPQNLLQALKQRGKCLDLLLALYGERGSPPMTTGRAEPVRLAGAALAMAMEQVEWKRSLLSALPRLRAERGAGIDYLAEDADVGSSGCERMCRALLGIDLAVPPVEPPPAWEGAPPAEPSRPRGPLLSALEREGITLVATESGASIGKPLHSLDRIIEETFDPVSALPSVGAGAPPAILSARQVLGNAGLVLHRDAISEGFLAAAAAIENYRLGVLPGDRDVTVVCKAEREASFRLVGRYVDVESAVAAAQQVADVMRWLSRMCFQLYVVEHSLLRVAEGAAPAVPAHSAPDEAADWDSAALSTRGARDFEHSFTVTAVLSLPPPGLRPLFVETAGGEVSEDALLRQVLAVIRDTVPAHIDVIPCLLSPAQLLRFEELQGRWKQALSQQSASELAIAAGTLRSFLQEHSSLPGSASVTPRSPASPAWSDAPTAQRR